MREKWLREEWRQQTTSDRVRNDDVEMMLNDDNRWIKLSCCCDVIVADFVLRMLLLRILLRIGVFECCAMCNACV